MFLSKRSKPFSLGFLSLLVVSGTLFYAVLMGGGEAIGQPGMNVYPTSPPGQSKIMERPYKNAPPAVPHSVEGMQITRSGNDCLGCHAEGIEVEQGHIATKVPPSHYGDQSGSLPARKEISGMRFQCLQCHVPQSEGGSSLFIRK